MPKQYGYVIINSGEQAIVYNIEGEARIVDGPQRLFLWREKIEFLRRVTASQNEYLVVKFRDGRVQHIKGPCSMFRVPTVHDSITNKKGVTLDAHEVVVVYRHNGGASERTVERHLEYGPKLFMLESNEWLHHFCWHGMDPENKTRYIPGTNKFTKLKLIPDQFYYNVDEIRTSDNGLVRVKLMIFHEINDVEMMLGSTHDPIGDIISCICADVTSFTAVRSYVEFVETSSKLNELENYPQLTAMCKGSGIRVTKIVFRGYFAAPKIQANHDQAIHRRTDLQLQFEKEQQQQDLQDRELSADRERVSHAQRLEMEELKQTHKLQAMKVRQQLALDSQHRQQAIERRKLDEKIKVELLTKEYAESLKHYSELKGLGVDVTKYMLNQAGVPDRTTKIVSGRPPTLHMHVNAPNATV